MNILGSRCTLDKDKVKKINKTVKKEKGCTKPLYGKKSKCVIKIVPQETKCNTFQMDKKCKKSRKLTLKKGKNKKVKTRKVKTRKVKNN